MPLSTKVIRVPVKLVDGQWEVVYGGPVRVADGAVGELHLDRTCFSDPDFLKALTGKRMVEVLPAGSELRVALSIRQQVGELARHIVSEPMRYPTGSISESSRFVSVTLGEATQPQRARGLTSGGLRLRLEGMEPRAMESGTVRLPAAEGVLPHTAVSLNHAFTLLSRVFEPWRKAHTASVYERVFYRESNDTWYPLKTLRNRTTGEAERTVIAGLWARIEQALGDALQPRR